MALGWLCCARVMVSYFDHGFVSDSLIGDIKMSYYLVAC